VSRAKLLMPVVALPLFALAPLLVASCADSDDANPHKEDASSVVQPGSDASSTDASDAGVLPCDAGDPTCVSELLTCEEADFCPVPSGVDPRYVLTAVWGSSASDVWAVGSGGTITHWDGAAWRSVPSGTRETLNAVWGSSASDVWVAGSTASILRSSGAAPWTNVPAFSDDVIAYHGRMHAVWGSSASDVRVGGQAFRGDLVEDETVVGSVEGNLLHTTTADPGGSNLEVVSGLDGRWAQATVLAIWGTSSSDLWVSLDNGNEEPWARGTLAHGVASAPGEPLVWTPVDSKSNAPLESLWGSSANDVWAVGDRGEIRRFSGGTSFAVVDGVPTTESLHGVWGSGPKDVWVVGDAGTILHFDGATWTKATAAFPLGKKPDLRGVWGSGPNDVWVVGDAFALHFTGKKAGR